MIRFYNKTVPLFLTWFLHHHVYYFKIWQGCFSTAMQARALCKTDVHMSDIHFPQVFLVIANNSVKMELGGMV